MTDVFTVSQENGVNGADSVGEKNSSLVFRCVPLSYSCC